VTPTPEPTPVDTSVTAAAIVVPIRSAELAARVSGVVESIFVREGAQALANQLLLRLDQSSYLDAIDTAAAEVTTAANAVAAAQLAVDQLSPDASPGQIQSVQANLRLAQSELEVARAALAEAQGALLLTEIRAPFAGTVADVAIEVGEQAIVGESVITLGDLSSWLIETTDLSELEVVRVFVGDRAAVTFDALPGLTLAGTVDRIQVRGTSSGGGVVFAVSIEPDSHEPRLRWGMSATVRIAPSG
jgi:RND family efflux transporter MFP subunit